jgi:hypothetical protein
MPVVPTPDDIDVVWLNQRLVEAGHDVELAGFSQADVGTGQVGRCICYQLQYGSQVADAPASLVAKFSSDDPTSRDTGQAMKTYRTEVDFYRHIAPKVSIRVPKCYYAEIDDEDREHLLLMQDMAPAQQGDQVTGCSVEVARQAVLELVGLQAPTWQDDSWQSLLGRVQDGPFADMKGLYNNTMPGFVERYAEGMDASHIRFIEAIGAADQCPMFEFHGEHFALEHYDFRLDNVMIDERRATPVITTVDWQSVRVGKPLNDVAYFIGSGLPVGLRREAVMDILREYHAALLAAGVEGFDWDTCYREYRKGIYAGFAVSIVAPVLVVRTDRGDEMFTTMASRYAQMALDHGIEEFLL